MEVNKLNGLFFVWKKYQRRPEVLASLINCQVTFIPHLFKSKYLRLIDYAIKMVVSIKDILKKKPSFIVAQCPPTFSAIPALITKVTYIIDAHNPLFQVAMWQKLPLTKYLIQNALAIIVHNTEMFELVKKIYPTVKLFTISDPIEFIAASNNQKRQAKQILVIASFDPWDEPIELLIKTMEELREFNFIVTADVSKLPLETAKSIQKLNNVNLTGFLETEEYHQVLCSSIASLVLTTSNATQPSGACEALSSNTQLIISKTSLTQELFGEWAVLVDNSEESIVKAIRSLSLRDIDLAVYRNQWNMLVKQEILELVEFINRCDQKK
jgi:glycosyltransferase involved in cell wall biosynthesis